MSFWVNSQNFTLYLIQSEFFMLCLSCKDTSDLMGQSLPDLKRALAVQPSLWWKSGHNDLEIHVHLLRIYYNVETLK